MNMKLNPLESDMEEDWKSVLFSPSTSVNPGETPFWEKDLVPKAIQRNEPDAIWLIPIDISPQEFFGEKKFIINKIRNATGAYMLYNDDLKQIEMWGTPSSINEAKRAWDSRGEHILGIRQDIRQKWKYNKRKMWNRPNTPAQERKQHCKKERIDKEDRLNKNPVINKQYNDVCVLSMEPINVQKIFGKGEEHLKKIRQDTNCHIWFELDDNILRIAGDNSDNVDMATTRVKTLFLQKTQVIASHILHLLQAPQNLIRIKLEDAKIIRPIQWNQNMEVKVLRAVRHHFIPGNKVDTEEEDYQNIVIRNHKSFREALHQALTQLCIFNGEIGMTIRIGQVCLNSYPNKEKWKAIKLYDTVLPSNRLSSLFASELFYSKEDIVPLLEYLSKEGLEFTTSPKTVYQIRARNTDKTDRITPHNFSLSLEFNTVQNVSAWTIDTQEKEVLTVNWIFPENEYSWQLNLFTKKSLFPEHDSLWGKFISRIRLSEQGRFIFTNTVKIQLLTMSKVTEWIYSWHDFVVEVWREELWTYDGSDTPGLEVVLPPIPDRTCFGVKLKYEPWSDKFADNRFLRPGETTQWKAEDISSLEKITEFTSSLSEFITILERTLNNR